MPSLLAPIGTRLWRWWGTGERTLLWVLLNPSTANAHEDDATLRRCIQFSRREGYERLAIVNLFALRATHPKELTREADPVGPRCDHSIRQACVQAQAIIVGWGTGGTLGEHDRAVLDMLPRPLLCFGRTSNGSPRHPLYLKRDTALQLYL